jgi:hypothetical protein
VAGVLLPADERSVRASRFWRNVRHHLQYTMALAAGNIAVEASRNEIT